ncbi:hypothetical protein [Aliikangiella coralliicola]|uniref:Uncharacterized protein n=1 Tax=Aliikangiella coralliicola TaxID=2592383 RepID=A0A545U0G5_9GAMM|nr:hypothetical protein [Aliikangiella coralliicola]TQV82955.1 hypothetical protein FLL46_24605 [Aliikangiella coralliicola]
MASSIEKLAKSVFEKYQTFKNTWPLINTHPDKTAVIVELLKQACYVTCSNRPTQAKLFVLDAILPDLAVKTEHSSLGSNSSGKIPKCADFYLNSHTHLCAKILY